MASHDPYEIPDVTISGALALALGEALEWAEHRTRDAESTAREELMGMRAALDRDVVDAAPPLGRVRWVSGLAPDVAQDLAREAPQVWHVPPQDLAPYLAASDQAVKRMAREAGIPVDALRPTTGEALRREGTE